MSQPLLTAADIFAAADLPHEDVAVPEWGGNVRLQQLHAADMSSLTDRLSTPMFREDGMPLMVAYCARTESGAMLFDFKRPDPAEETAALRVVCDGLKLKSFNILNKLQTVGLRLNRMDTESKAALKKELGGAPTDASPIV